MSRIEDALRKAEKTKKVGLYDYHSETVSSEVKGETVAAKDKSKISALLDVSPINIENLLIATARDEENAIVEEYNKLRSVVISLTKGETFKNTILVTSTVSEEGKSMTALNLSISLAKEHDHTVLLVDTDLRRPSVHRFLNLRPEVGLVNCLRDDLPIEQALIKTGVGKLVVLPAGEAVKDPVDMLSSNRMRDIIVELKERYPERYIVFDTPPALPFADASVLAKNIDSTLFVVREGRADINDIKKTIEEFKAFNLMGVVYNDAHAFLKRKNYYYY